MDTEGSQDDQPRNTTEERNELAIRNQLLCGLMPWEQKAPMEYESLVAEINSSFRSFNPQEAVNMISQFRKQGEIIDYVLIAEEGQAHDPRFIMQGILGDETYPRVIASSKTRCKQACAYLIWKSILEEEVSKLEIKCSKASTSTEERISALAHLKYWRLVQKDATLMRGKKVLAACVMEKKQRGLNNNLFEVISLGTGNRFINNGHLVCDGTVVIDGHAEVIARRGLVLYLYQELLKAAQSNSSSIFEAFRNGRTKLRKEISFHLYVSTAPCGDSSLFTHSGKIKKIEGSEHYGTLRYKFEKGEACRPTAKFSNFGGSLIAAQFGDQSITKMCCSDKICKWNVLGVQGALLSNFIDAIYLKSITIGENFDEEHSKRAFSYRLGMDQTNKVPVIPDLLKPFRIATPRIASSTFVSWDSSIPETKNMNEHCLVWSAASPEAQALSANTGQTFQREQAIICKRKFLDEYLRIREVLGESEPQNDQSYNDFKNLSTGYQSAKQQLYDRFKELGYGPWLSLFPELGMFTHLD